jgi:hypothetical protein
MGFDLLGLPGDLDVSVVRRSVATQHNGSSTHTLAADQANFHSRLGVHRHDRRDAGFEEIHGLDSPIGRLDVLLEGKRHRL